MMLRCPCALDHLQMPELHSRPDVDVHAVLHAHPPSLVLGGVPLGISDDARQSSLNPHMAERIHPLVGLVSHDPSNHHVSYRPAVFVFVSLLVELVTPFS